MPWKFLLIFFSAGLSWSAAAHLPTEYVEGDAIVTFRGTTSLNTAKDVLGKHALQFAEHFAGLSARRGKHTGLVRTKARTTAQLIAELKKDPDVESAEPNFRRWTNAQPNDTRFGDLWALQNSGQSVNGTAGISGDDIKFAAAWNLARPTANQVVIGVIDTGVNFSHPDLVASMWTNPGEIVLNSVDDDGDGFVDDTYGYNFIEGNADPSDSGFHGTHVAGTIAAAGNNHLGVTGIDFQAKIMALKVSSDGETIDSASVISALQYATTMKGRGVNIVALNASFGGGGSSSAEIAAIQAAGNAGIIFCAAAGNSGTNNDTTPSYPASYRLSNMIVVGASDQSDALASFSNYGATTVDLAAPGVNILSTKPVTASLQVSSTAYAANPMSFSGATAGISGTLVDCGLGNPGEFPAAVNGNIALIARGTLTFVAKVTNAMAVGARAAVIYNNVSGGFFGTLQTPSNWIPAVSISQASGAAIKALANPTGSVVVAADYQYLEGTSMATPHVSGAVAFAAMNFPDETVAERIQRILTHVDVKPSLQGKVATNGRLNLQRIVDTDSNGLPDWWEKTYFNQLTGIDPNSDSDRDGQTNLREFLSGTSPADAQSALRVSSFVKNNVGSSSIITWASVPGKTYQVLHDALLTDTWLADLPNSQITAAAGQTSLSYTDTTAGGANQRFYRIEIVLP
jgi:subtilisin family serine protease